MTFDGTWLSARVERVKLLESLIPSYLNRVLFFDLTTYDMFAEAKSATATIAKVLANASLQTGTTANCYARVNLNANETYMSGVSIWRAYGGYLTGNCFGFMGIKAALLTTENSHVMTDAHAAFIYNNGVWYASVANGSAQTTANITASITDLTHVWKVDGSQAGHMRFYVDGMDVEAAAVPARDQANATVDTAASAMSVTTV
jgi:hypothetical protein